MGMGFLAGFICTNYKGLVRNYNVRRYFEINKASLNSSSMFRRLEGLSGCQNVLILKGKLANHLHGTLLPGQNLRV